MFVQVIRGRAKDTDKLRAAGENWQKELRPGATGYLGSTHGVAEDGTAVTIVRPTGITTSSRARTSACRWAAAASRPARA